MPELTFLGTSNAFGHTGRHTACYLLSGSHNILIDAGYSMFSAIRANFVEFPRIDAILLSHLHPDHFMGIPQMVLEDYYVIKREYQIKLFGPIGLKKKILDCVKVMYNEEVLNHTTALFEFNEYGIDEEFNIPGGKVKTLGAGHSGNARMQIIEFDGKSIGYSGDTSYIKAAIYKLLECDVSIIEASSYQNFIPDHITAQELLDLDIPATSKVYLSHLGHDVRMNEDKFKPPLFLADDGMKIEL